MAGREYRLSIIVTGKDSGASSMLGGLAKNLNSMRTIAGGIIASQVFTSIGRGIGNMAREAIGATGEIQKMSMMLQTLQARELIKTGKGITDFNGDGIYDMNDALKSAEPLAAATLKQLEDIAIASPFQLKNVNNAYRLAMAYGYTSKEATKFTQATLNMAAGIGAEGEMLDRMSYNLAQIRNQGHVTAIDMRQLAMAGFDLGDVLKYVGDQMGVNIRDHNDFNRAIQNGRITWEDFTDHYAEYAEKNFGGASERMSRTLVGLKSTFADVFELSMPKILGPAVESMTGWLNGLLDKFKSIRDSGALEAVGEKLGKFTDGAIKTMDKLVVWFGKGRWGKIEDFFLNGFVGMTEKFKDAVYATDWDIVGENFVKGVEKIDFSKIGMKLREGLRNVLLGLGTTGLELDLTNVGNAITEGFVDFIGALFFGNASAFESIEKDWTFIGDSVSAMLDREGELIKTRWDEFKTTWSFNLSSFGNYVRENFASNLGLSMLGPAGMLASLLPDSAWDEFKTTWAFNLTSAMEWMKTGLIQQGSTLGAAFPLAISGALNGGLSVLAAGVSQWVMGITASFIGPFASLGATLGGFLGEMVNMMRSKAIEMVVSIVSPFSNLGGLLRSALDSAMGGIVASLSAWVGQINAVLSQIGSGLSGLMGGGLGGILGGSSAKPKPKPNNPFGSSGLSGGMQSFSGGGIATGPLSGYQALLHGTEAVIPLNGGGIPVQLLPSQAGGGNINIQLVYAPGISTASRREFEDEIAPFVREGVRSEFQKRGL